MPLWAQLERETRNRVTPAIFLNLNVNTVVYLKMIHLTFVPFSHDLFCYKEKEFVLRYFVYSCEYKEWESKTFNWSTKAHKLQYTLTFGPSLACECLADMMIISALISECHQFHSVLGKASLWNAFIWAFPLLFVIFKLNGPV